VHQAPILTSPARPIPRPRVDVRQFGYLDALVGDRQLLGHGPLILQHRQQPTKPTTLQRNNSPNQRHTKLPNPQTRGTKKTKAETQQTAADDPNDEKIQ
jgi:hypothetical protein